MIPSLYLRLAAILIPTAIAGVVGYNIGAGRWEAKYEALHAEGWEQKAKGEETARRAVEKQLADATATATNNAEALAHVQTVTSDILADRDQLRRLLARATRSIADSRPMPEATGESGIARAGPPRGDGRVDKLVTRAERAITECKLNSVQLDGLIAQIKPQL